MACKPFLEYFGHACQESHSWTVHWDAETMGVGPSAIFGDLSAISFDNVIDSP
jgi:hypothetical protein